MGKDVETLIKEVMDCAIEVRRILSSGYLEKVYENALMIELESAGLKARCQQPISVLYKGHVIGEFSTDIIVDDCLVLELKAVENLKDAHELQLVNYLTALGIDDGLLINFGNSDKIQIKRKYRVYSPRTTKQKT